MSTVHVYTPTKLMFICGGQFDLTSSKPQSLRDAFLRFCHEVYDEDHRIVTAEDINSFVVGHIPYGDILSFEFELAQVSDLIVLFSESYGSAAELGAFCMDRHISERLLVVVDDLNFMQTSFIKQGPLKILRNLRGESAICVLYREDIGIKNILDVSSLNATTFKQRVTASISKRLASSHISTTFDRGRLGHVIRFIVGLLQHYGALNLTEIELFLERVGIEITTDQILRLLLCAEFAGWVVKEHRGGDEYYAVTVEKEAPSYRLLTGVGPIDKRRWRADIVRYWEVEEPDRFNCIQAAIRGIRGL
jgi:hypothetical protein